MCSLGKCVIQMKMSCLQVTTFLIESTLYPKPAQPLHLSLARSPTLPWTRAAPHPVLSEEQKNPAQLFCSLPFVPLLDVPLLHPSVSQHSLTASPPHLCLTPLPEQPNQNRR